MASNVLLTTQLVVDTAMAVLFQTPTFLDKINTQYDSKFSGKGAQVGDTVSVRVPQRALIRDGRVMNIQPQIDQVVPVKIQKQLGVDVGATSASMALDINDFQEEFIDTKIPDLVAAVEQYALAQCIPTVYNHADGSFGSFNTSNQALSAGKYLADNLAPPGNRTMLINTLANTEVVPALQGLFNPQTTIGDQFREGLMGRNTLGFDWYQTTLMPTYTRGGANGSYVLNGVPASGATTAVVATGSGTFVVGDIFTIAGMNAVHPQTKTDMGYLRKFVITAAFAGGAGTITFSPALNYAVGSQQNVTAAPATNAAVTILGAASTLYQQNIAFSKDAFYFVTADLPLPKGMGVECASRTWKGITMRFMNGFDISQDMFVSRFDILFGAGPLRPELACRLSNT